MTINAMRMALFDEYPDSPGWHKKVVNMKANQVIAIYKSIQKRKIKLEREARREAEYHQMDIFEYQVLLALENNWKGSNTEVVIEI